MKIGFIGAGKVGCTLGKYFVTKNIDVTGFYSRSEDSASKAAEFTDTKMYHSIIDLVRDSDIIFITVTDMEIQKLWEQIKILPIKSKIICHCSGSISSAIFSDISQCGAYGYSIHPLLAISNKEQSYKEIPEALFVIEGDCEKISYILDFLQSINLKVQIIDKCAKEKYHCSAVFASNLVAGLVDISIELLEECGFDKENAKTALNPLIRNNIENILENGLVNGLTGPIERNDTETIKKHLGSLEGDNKEIYRLLSKRVIGIALKKHKTQEYGDLTKMLD